MQYSVYTFLIKCMMDHRFFMKPDPLSYRLIQTSNAYKKKNYYLKFNINRIIWL